MFRQNNTPSQTRSKPSFSAIGTKIGAVRNRMPIQSMKQPRMIQIDLEHDDDVDRLERQRRHRVLDQPGAAGERVDADQRRRAEEQPVQHHGDLGRVLDRACATAAQRHPSVDDHGEESRRRRRRPRPRWASRCRDRASRAPSARRGRGAISSSSRTSFSRSGRSRSSAAAQAAQAPARSSSGR